MSGWNRTSLKGVVKTKAFWLRYGLCFAQILVIVAYLLPWERLYPGAPYPDYGLLEWMHSRLAHDLSASQAFFIASLISCFMAAIISLALTLPALTGREGCAAFLRSSSILSSLAIVGPLLFLHRCQPPPVGRVDLSHPWLLFEDTAIGLYIALLSGLTACVLLLILYRDACKTSRDRSQMRESPLARIRVTTFSFAYLFIIVTCCVTTVVGFFLTWNAGSASGWVGDPLLYSNSGSEISPAMYLVPLAAVLYTWLFILDTYITKPKSLALDQASQNLLVIAFALTLFWGLAFGEYRFFGVDTPLFVAKLQLGWYLCVISQLILLVSAVSSYDIHFAAAAHHKPQRLKGASE